MGIASGSPDTLWNRLPGQQQPGIVPGRVHELAETVQLAERLQGGRQIADRNAGVTPLETRERAP